MLPPPCHTRLRRDIAMLIYYFFDADFRLMLRHAMMLDAEQSARYDGGAAPLALLLLLRYTCLFIFAPALLRHSTYCLLLPTPFRHYVLPLMPMRLMPPCH